MIPPSMQHLFQQQQLFQKQQQHQHQQQRPMPPPPHVIPHLAVHATPNSASSFPRPPPGAVGVGTTKNQGCAGSYPGSYPGNTMGVSAGTTRPPKDSGHSQQSVYHHVAQLPEEEMMSERRP